MTASPYFDGLICHGMSRIPYLVGENLKHSIREYQDYYEYHFNEYSFLFFEYKNEKLKIYFHSEMNDLVFQEISWSGLLSFLNSL